MECYACDQEATQRCDRCGNAYCPDHGDDPAVAAGQAYCADCLDPVNATPSGVVFRASLIGLFIASVVALWLLVRPPSLPGESSGAIQPLPIASPTALPSASPPSPSPGAPAEATPAPQETPAPTAEPAPAAIQYTIQDGDTISSIAAANGISYLDLLEYNGLTEEDAQALLPGDVISIPQ
jgi:LysM repeat protein